jgi:hypothetical protein
MDANWIIILDKVVIPVILAIVAPILVVLAKKALDVFQEKTGLEVSKEHRSLLEDLVGKGIAFAEEQARKALKSGDAAPDGSSKLELAIDFISTNAEAMGLDTKADDLAKLIEAKLFEDRPETSADEGLEDLKPTMTATAEDDA